MDALVGRSRELAAALQRLDRAAAGHGGVVAIVGGAGIGKSALAAAIADAAKARGFAVTQGRALDLTDAPPLLPVRAGLRALGVAIGVDVATAGGMWEVWEEALEALARASSTTPHVWIIEDLHAADAQTLDLLAFLAHPARQVAALLVVTTRPATEALEASAHRLARVLREADAITLGPLADDDAAALARSVLADASSETSVRQVVERAGGHPLFVVELARAQRGGAATAVLPATIVHVVEVQMARLPPESRALVAAASVLGLEFHAALVARMTDRLPAAAIDGLVPAIRRGLVVERAPGQFRFSHAVVRDAIHDAIARPDRNRLHARAMALLAEQSPTLECLVRLASHAIAAGEAVDPAETASRVATAAADLDRCGAPDRAFALLSRWLDAGHATPPPDAMLQAARHAARAGAFVAARRLSEEALALGRERNDAFVVGEAALVFGANLRPSFVDRALVTTLEQALAGLAPIPPSPERDALRCRLRLRLAAAIQPADDLSVPVAMAREAIAEARQIGDAAVVRDALFLGGSALVDCTDAAECFAVADELHRAALAARDEPLQLRALVRRAMSAATLGDLAGFLADTGGALSLARRIGHPSLVWRALVLASMRASMLGEFAQSERLVEELEQLGLSTDDPALGLSTEAHRWAATLARDDVDQIAAMRPGFARVAEMAPPRMQAFLGAVVANRLEDTAGAARSLVGLTRAGIPAFDVAATLVAGESAALVGDRDACIELRPRLVAFGDGCGVSSQIDFAFLGSAARVVALIDAALGRHDAAIAGLRRERDRMARHGFEPWVAMIDLAIGRVLVASGEHDAAREVLDTARARAEGLGMRGTAMRAEAARPGAAVERSAAHRVQAEASPRFALTREADGWTVTWGTRRHVIRDSRGVELLARVVASPGERIHVLVLGSDAPDAAIAPTDAGPALDATALAQYRARIADLDRALEQAEAIDDIDRGVRLVAERDAIAAELRRAVGLGGRSRKVGSATERARVNVTRRLKEAIGRIAEVAPDAGEYLRNAVRTGTYCSFRP